MMVFIALIEVVNRLECWIHPLTQVILTSYRCLSQSPSITVKNHPASVSWSLQCLYPALDSLVIHDVRSQIEILLVLVNCIFGSTDLFIKRAESAMRHRHRVVKL